MQVIATAGHVDHGKSTLVEALTGQHPDRLAEERRRGLTIELGYCWASWPEAGDVAFVDVPGHERFVSTMLAGAGPVPAALLVVAADDPWMPQAAEHLAALDALGVQHAVVAVTRSDLADPGEMIARAHDEVGRTGLRGAPVVAVSAVTGSGLEALREALAAMVSGLPQPDPADDVRLWADRSFHVSGAGTVVTGTLPAGTIGTGTTLRVDGESGSATVRVRGVQTLGRPVAQARGTARVALNVVRESRGDRGAARAAEGRLDRHAVLTTPGAFHLTVELDGRLVTGPRPRRPPTGAVLHVGAAAVPVRVRPLADDVVRLRLERPLPLRVGDRALLRDPGDRRLWGLDVLDPDPPALRRRGAARERAGRLAAVTLPTDPEDELDRRGLVHVDRLRRLGVAPPPGRHPVHGWLLSDARAAEAQARVVDLVAEHERERPLEPGLALAGLADRLGLPHPDLLAAVLRPPLRVREGRVRMASDGLPDEVRAAVDRVRTDLESDPFGAPTAARLCEHGLTPSGLSAAAQAGELLHLGDGLVLLPDAADHAVALLSGLRQPFTTSEARQRWGTSRRVALPLLTHLDRRGLTRRLPDDRRTLTGRGRGEVGAGSASIRG